MSESGSSRSIGDSPTRHWCAGDASAGAGHPAGLNYGDTFSYALARRMGLPLLFVGEDFARTDVQAA